jgi:hypothetical protein
MDELTAEEYIQRTLVLIRSEKAGLATHIGSVKLRALGCDVVTVIHSALRPYVDCDSKGRRIERRATLFESRSVFIIYMHCSFYSPKSTMGRTILLSYLPPT